MYLLSIAILVMVIVVMVTVAAVIDILRKEKHLGLIITLGTLAISISICADVIINTLDRLFVNSTISIVDALKLLQ